MMGEIKSNKFFFPFVLSGIAILMSICAYIFFVYRNFVGLFFGAMDKSWFDVMFLYFLLALILSVIGLIIGIKKRKITSRVSGILGIVVPVIAILLTLFSGWGVSLSIILSTT